MWPRFRGRGVTRRETRGRGGSFRGTRGGFIDKRRPYNRPGPSTFNKNLNRPASNKKRGNKTEKLHESDVAITEYINTQEKFSGILKERYSDFQVNEIDLDGNIAKLTDMSIPKDPDAEKMEEDDEGLFNRYRIEQLPTETWDKIHKMVQGTNKNEVIEIDVTSVTKEERTKIHEAVKMVFGRKVVGCTNTKDDKKVITFRKYNKNVDKIDMREKWPTCRGGEYVHFLVHKEFIDTIEASIQISEKLQMRPSSFCYAGVKDRRAKTTQWFCVRKVEPSKLIEKTKGLKNIYIGNICFKKETLRLGQLNGNRFRIALREIDGNDNEINVGLESLQNKGFINYYGLQRFGHCKEIPTHAVGIQLLLGNWKEAVKLILKPRSHEQHNDISSAKTVYENTGDAVEAHSRLKKNRNKSIEGRLLGGLVRCGPNDFVNALESVPRNMRLLYIHSYQSLVWNTVVSKRIKEFGLVPIVGDVVVEGDFAVCEPVWETPDEVAATLERDIPENGNGNKDDKFKPTKVKVLTEQDLPNYTIYDIVLPLPGYDITYPTNIVKDWYDEILTKDGLTLEMPKQKVKMYTLSGAYRKIVERPTNMSWHIVHYNDKIADLIRSDYEELQGKPEPQDSTDGKYRAVIIDFCLSSSCYATMALREVVKTRIVENFRKKSDKSEESSDNNTKSFTEEENDNEDTTNGNMQTDKNNIPKQESETERIKDTPSKSESTFVKQERDEVHVKMEVFSNEEKCENIKQVIKLENPVDVKLIDTQIKTEIKSKNIENEVCIKIEKSTIDEETDKTNIDELLETNIQTVKRKLNDTDIDNTDLKKNKS